jgi:hypothetical protein
MGSRILAKKTHTEAYWQTKAPPTLIRCTANYVTTGTRCRSEAATGTTVCDKHGARLPTVQAAAAQRIGESAMDMVEKLLAWANDPNVDMRERVKIAQDMLDRAGHKAADKHLVGVVGKGDALETLFMDLLSNPDALTGAQAAEPSTEPWPYNQAVLDDPEFGAPRVIPGEIVRAPTPRPAHTVHSSEPLTAPTPKHIRDALAELI